MALILFWDASALVKRYVPEPGDVVVDSLFASPDVRMVSTFLGYAETFATLVRKRNSGIISTNRLNLTTSALLTELIVGDFEQLTLDDNVIVSSVRLILKHNLNSVDAILLGTFLEYQSRLPAGSPTCVLVVADGRFNRAATAEGLATLDPEAIAAADVPAFLASLS